MFLYNRKVVNISCMAIYCSRFIFLSKDNRSINSKTQTAWFAVAFKRMFNTPVPRCFTRSQPYCRLPSWGEKVRSCSFLFPSPDHSLSGVLQEASTGWWVAQTETRMAGDETRLFSLKASLNHVPLKLQPRHSLYCSIRPHNFSVWRREAKFRSVAISILISWKWLRVRRWVLCCSSPRFSHSGSCLGGGSAYRTPANPSPV